jgi:enediyne biosynthesis protein E4
MRTSIGRFRARAPSVGGAVMTVLVLVGCGPDERTPPLFELLSPEATGIGFVNELPDDPELNIVNYLYYYNGGGIAVGDIDNDGLPDLYFTSNLGPNRLYRNKGNYQFEDITERAGVAGLDGWTSGVTMADVNGDGWMDIYVSGVSYRGMQGRNILYINNGDGTFTDRTEEYGLGHVGYSTQAVFFDYDGDGDLDMYLLNYSSHSDRGIRSHPQRTERHPRAGDRLFRNEGGRFVDVSEEAGIFGGVEGYGLGVVVSDFDLDGCPDLFVANDFQENDFLYFNNCDGTFTESIATAMAYTSRFSMGVDAADFNNDGRPDLFVLDMLPDREDILKTSAGAEPYQQYQQRIQAGYHPQYARNTLHLNRGGRRFSEIGYLAGVHATDWSWAALFADFDNDGFKDLFVTNGIYRRPNDLDYIERISDRAVQASLAGDDNTAVPRLLEWMPHVPIPNHAYHNDGGRDPAAANPLTFTDRTAEWGLAQPGFSSGAVYVDLNDSGALDLVVNNINAPAAIYRNRARERNGHGYLQLELRGSGGNTAGIGAKVVIWHDGMMQMLEQFPTRGFQSSVDPRLHFGIGRSTRIDSLLVVWPDHAYQLMTDLPVDRRITLAQEDAGGRYDHATAAAPPPLFADVTDRLMIEYRHEEDPFVDFSREPLMPHRLSIEGPALAIGDVDGDGLDDIYVGGAKWQPGRLFLQQPDGTFRPGSAATFAADSLHEDVDAVFFDATGNGHPDLYVVSGGNEFSGEHEAMRDRLYLNDGTGEFRRAVDALPPIFQNGATVVPGDFNGDGHVDLFVGGRSVVRHYGLTPHSYLLQNDGTGRFLDVTSERAGALAEVGLVTSAAWVDIEGDGQLDLVVVGEWMPVRVFRQRNGRFEDRTAAAGLAGTNGWWNTVAAADLTGDGRTDLVLGNLGLNSYIRASRSEPARLYVHDFSGNGTLEQILTSYRNGVSYPMLGRDELVRPNPRLRSRFDSYAAFGASRIEDLFPPSELRQATVREAYLLATSIALNRGDGTFRIEPLPLEAQFAPVYAVLADDFDGDGHADLLLAGNFHGVTPVRGRYAASFGLLLKGDGSGRFEAVDTQHSGLTIDGQTRNMGFLRHAGGDRFVVVARNSDSLRVLHPLR